jgi:hypothetical protein
LSSNKFYIRECPTVNSIIELIQDLCVGSEDHESQFCATVTDRWLRASKDLSSCVILCVQPEGPSGLCATTPSIFITSRSRFSQN